jgi:hypothetical protein
MTVWRHDETGYMLLIETLSQTTRLVEGIFTSHSFMTKICLKTSASLYIKKLMVFGEK